MFKTCMTLALVAAFSLGLAAPSQSFAGQGDTDAMSASQGDHGPGVDHGAAPETVDSQPPMYLTSFAVGAWQAGTHGNKKHAVGRAVISDEFGNPVSGALVEVDFGGDCLRRPDSGSAYTDEENGLADVFGTKTFSCGKGCILTGDVVAVTHPDFTWDPDGGVSTHDGTLCR